MVKIIIERNSTTCLFTLQGLKTDWRPTLSSTPSWLREGIGRNVLRLRRSSEICIAPSQNTLPTSLMWASPRFAEPSERTPSATQTLVGFSAHSHGQSQDIFRPIWHLSGQFFTLFVHHSNSQSQGIFRQIQPFVRSIFHSV